MPEPTSTVYDAIVVVSFGGPEGPGDVIPFLENVLRGRNVPRERMIEVAEHYYRFGGKSPINAQNRALIAALEVELKQNGPRLPVYWGNRNWDPLLTGTLRQMAQDGVEHALAFVTSAYSSYSSCRQYLDNIARARQDVGPKAPVVHKLRTFYNHPGFIDPVAENAKAALSALNGGTPGESVELVFTAHSIPTSMAANCRYVEQLEESSRLVAEQLGFATWKLVYQSRSGPPSQPWLEPDIRDCLKSVHEAGRAGKVLIVPIGFVSDHLEVLYDLDTEAKELCDQLGLRMMRSATVGNNPAFVRMIRELVLERMEEKASRRAMGSLGPSHDHCPADCCPPPQRR
jgi:ferrochelatase